MFFLFSFYAFAEGSKVSEVRFEGLKKTKESYVQKLLEKYTGMEEENVDIKEIETLLQAQGLFSEINVSLSSEGDETPHTVIVVKVKEKITFLPLPFASYSSDGFMGGFMLMNMNAFGKKYTLVGGGVFSPSVQTGMLAFSKPAVDIRHPGLSFYTSLSRKNLKFLDFAGNTVMDNKYFTAAADLSVSEKLLPFFTCSIGSHFDMADVLETDDYPALYQWAGTMSFSLQNVDWNGWYLISQSANLRGELGWSSDEKLIGGCSFKGELQIPFVPRIRGILSGSGAFTYNQNEVFWLSKSSGGSSILDSKFRTDFIAGTSFTVEIALLKRKFGTVSLYGSYEYVIAHDFDDTFKSASGPGFGGKLYLQQVAFPAVVMGAAYNINRNKWQYVISVGVNF
ncbi:MAG: hypothetical protein II098_10535 [Treponema sp.]|nr:hypothetical protein [Treponema sp.]